MSTTPAPEVLDDLSIKTVKDLIEANPADPKLQNIISQYKNNYPSVFEGVIPKPLSSLTDAAKEQRQNFIRALQECTKSDSNTVGVTVTQANPCSDTSMSEISNSLNNFFDKIQAGGNQVLNMPQEIRNVSDLVARGMTSVTNKMTGALNDKMESEFKAGLGQVHDSIMALVPTALPKPAAVAIIKGIQGGMLSPMQNAFDGATCGMQSITDAMEGVVSDLVTAAAKNITKAPACAVQELMGAVVNKTSDMMDSVAGPIMAPIEKTLGFAFNTKQFLTSGVDMLSKAEGLLSCGEKMDCPPSTNYVTGKGDRPSPSDSTQSEDFRRMFSGTSVTAAASDKLTAFEKEYGSWDIFGGKSPSSDIGPCGDPPESICGGPTVSIFGGGGQGGAGRVILGKFINRLDTNNMFASVQRTASIIGVEVTNPGARYMSEPIVTFDDECQKGEGAYGKATIDYNPKSPTYGQITSITMTTIGSKYPAESEDDAFVTGVLIDAPGSGYEDATLDNFEVVITDGRVTGVNVVNQIAYRDFPNMKIKSETGSGARLRPIMSNTRPQGKVLEIIDCVGKSYTSGEVN